MLVLSQLFNCFNARSASRSAFRGLFAGRWLWGTVVLSAALQEAVVHASFLNLAFGTAPLSLQQWLVCVAMASGVLWFRELQNCVYRAVARARRTHCPRSVAPWVRQRTEGERSCEPHSVMRSPNAMPLSPTTWTALTLEPA